jgi:hypothetical protein
MITAGVIEDNAKRYGIAVGPPDAGSLKYGGTLILLVPAGAIGTFQVGLGSQSFMLDSSNNQMLPLELRPAQITVVPEPSVLTLALVGFGTLALVTHSRRRLGHRRGAEVHRKDRGA